MASLNPLKFHAELKDDVTGKLNEIQAAFAKANDTFTFKVSIDGVDKLQSALNNLGTDGLSKITQSVKDFNDEMQRTKVKEFVGTEVFDNVFKEIKKVETAYNEFMTKWNNDASHSSNGPINPHAMSTAMQDSIKQLEVAVQKAWGSAGSLTPEAGQRFRQALEGAFSGLSNTIKNQLESGLIGSGYAVVRFKENMERQFADMGRLSQNLGPMSGYITNVADVATVLANAFQTVENRLTLLKDSLASDNFQKMATSANNAADAIQKLANNFGPLLEALGKNQELKNFMTGLGEIVNSIRALTKNNNALSVAASGPTMTADQMAKNLSINSQKIEVAYKRIAEAQAKAQEALGVGKQLGLPIDNSSMVQLREYVSYLDEVKTKLASLKGDAAAMSRSGATSAILGPKYSDAVQGINRLDREMRKMANGTAEAANNVTRLSQEETKLANAINNATNQAKNQNQILSDLRTMALQYMSVYGAYGFAKEMAQITGELELQKTSLQVILDSASKANEMYGQIRDLSQMSPFSFMDLMKSTRQLAAFGIETKDLYDTMKSLSDIGAGLNVDVNRLILAYGHTRSYGYLSGIQNRQFENAGIDMIGGLTEKYNKLAEAEKKAGREADYVTRKDVFKKMRNKEISFSDVEDVVMDLDKPGGKFYNMQQKQFDTLGGKLRNLKNNTNIMMSELGEKNRGVLMFAVSALTEVHENWRRYERIIYGVVAALGVMKAAQLAVGTAASSMNRQLMANARTNSLTNYSNGFMTAMGRGASWQQAGASGRKAAQHGVYAKSGYASDAFVKKEIVNNEKLNTLTKQRIALTGKLTTEQRAMILQSTGINKADATRIANLGRIRRGLMGIELGLKSAAIAVKSFMVSMLPMAAITGIVALMTKFHQAAEQAANVTSSMKDDSQKDIEGIRQTLKQYESAIKPYAVKNIKNSVGGAKYESITIDREVIEDMGVENVLDNLRQKLQSQSPLYEGDLFDMIKVGNQFAQVASMFEHFKKVDFVKQVEQNTADTMGKALEDTGAKWYHIYKLWNKGEGMIENFGDFAKANQKFMQAFEISDEEYNKLREEDRTKVERLVRDLGVTRDVAMAKFALTNEGGNLLRAVGARGLSFIRDNQWEDAFDDMQGPAEKMALIFKSYFNGDVDMETAYFEDFMNKIFTEAKVGDDESRNILRMQFIKVLQDAMPEKEGTKLMENVFNREIGAQVIKNIQASVNQDTKKEDLPGIVEKQVKAAIKRLKELNPEFAEQYAKVAEKNMQAYYNAANNESARLMNMEDWQARAKKMNIKVDVSTETDYTEFIEKQRKKLKEIQDIFNKNKQRIKWIVGADLSLDLNMKSVQNALKKMRDALKSIKVKESEYVKSHRDRSGKVYGSDWENVLTMRGQEETLNMMIENLTNMERVGAYMDAEHQAWDKEKKTKSKGKGSNKDKQAEDWLDTLRLIKEAYSWYKKWEKEVGKKAAIKMVELRFKGVLSEDILKDIETGYRPYVEKITKLAEDSIKKNGKVDKQGYIYDKRLQVAKTGESLQEDFDYQAFQDKSKDYADNMSMILDIIADKYDNFRKVLEATGDRSLAERIVGSDYEWKAKADVVRNWVESVISSIGAMDKISLDDMVFDDIFGEIPLSKAGNEAISDYVKNALGEVDENGNLTKESAQRIDGVIAVIEKWRDLEKELVKDSIAQYSELVKSMSDYASQVARIEGEYRSNVEMANKLTDPKAKKQAIDLYTAQRNVKLMELAPSYKGALSNPLSTSKQDAMTAVEMARKTYDDLWKKGGMSADEYTKKIQELNDALRAIDTNAVAEWVLFLEGGMDAVRNQRISRNKEIVADANRKIEMYNGEYNAAVASGNYHGAALIQSKIKQETERRDKAQKDINSDQSKNDANEKLNRALKAVVDALNKFLSALGLVDNTLQSLGLGKTAVGTKVSEASAIGGSMMQGASALSALGPYGMAAGAALGLVSGVAQVHDKQMQARIDDLQADVSKIENYTQTIATARNRALGYDTNSVLSRYKNQWSQHNSMTNWKFLGMEVNAFSSAAQAMQEYYGNANQNLSSYRTEYDMLVRKRQDYIDMYNAEQSKKNYSESQLEEYKSQIADLDDQIAYLTEDLAKELWGIDIKGWADQFADALSSAWENGTSAAEAYGDTVKEIIQGMGKQMMSLGILQPMFDSLQKTLFGEDGKGGLFNINDVEGSMPNVIDYVSKYFGDNGEGQKTITAASQFWDGIEQILNQYGLSAKNTASSTLSSGISGMSEETAGLLSGYINALRQDVSVMRILQTNFITQYWQDYVSAYTSAYKSVANIEQDVAAMRRVQADMADTLSDFYSKFRNVTSGTEKIYIQ